LHARHLRRRRRRLGSEAHLQPIARLFLFLVSGPQEVHQQQKKRRNMDEYRQRDHHPDDRNDHDVLPRTRFVEPVVHRVIHFRVGEEWEWTPALANVASIRLSAESKPTGADFTDLI
jgi:hypothetical protein